MGNSEHDAPTQQNIFFCTPTKLNELYSHSVVKPTRDNKITSGLSSGKAISLCASSLSVMTGIPEYVKKNSVNKGDPALRSEHAPS